MESEFRVPVWTPADNIIWTSSSLGWRIGGREEAILKLEIEE
jgi:hypothetical protein